MERIFDCQYEFLCNLGIKSGLTQNTDNKTNCLSLYNSVLIDLENFIRDVKLEEINQQNRELYYIDGLNEEDYQEELGLERFFDDVDGELIKLDDGLAYIGFTENDEGDVYSIIRMVTNITRSCDDEECVKITNVTFSNFNKAKAKAAICGEAEGYNLAKITNAKLKGNRLYSEEYIDINFIKNEDRFYIETKCEIESCGRLKENLNVSSRELMLISDKAFLESLEEAIKEIANAESIEREI